MDADEVIEKRREARLRRLAAKFNLRIEKSRIRRWDYPGYGGYELINIYSNFVVLGAGQFAYSATLDEIEAYLQDDDEQAAA